MVGIAIALAISMAWVSLWAAAMPRVTYAESPVALVSAPCSSGQNAEVEQAVDPALGYVYAAWMASGASGCQAIVFARSTDGGQRWDAPIRVPGSTGSELVSVWDPAVAVDPKDGTVYVAFMRSKESQWYPWVAVSLDHGASFAYVTGIVPPDAKNFGDRPFIAVAPNGTLYLTYSYGPERTSFTYACMLGSCGFLTGDLNIVVQWSSDRGKTWSPLVHVSPGFPASGGFGAPLWVEPSGRIDLIYEGFTITNTTTFTMNPANTFFTESTDGGATWSTPYLVGPGTGTMSLAEWWIDGALGSDSDGNLYATWDTQNSTKPTQILTEDIGWLCFSTDHGATWSNAVRVTPDGAQAAHIMEVAGGGPGIAYVTYLTNTSQGWALYLRVFSVTKGAFLTDPILVSTNAWGALDVWPGDTTGISTLSPTRVVVTWGNPVAIHGQPKSQIFAAVLDFAFP